jgi:hypothetical protein
MNKGLQPKMFFINAPTSSPLSPGGTKINLQGF